MTRNGRAAPRPESPNGHSSEEPVLILVTEDQRLRDDIALIAAVVGARLEIFKDWAQVARSTAESAVAVLCSPRTVPQTALQAEQCLLVGHEAESVWQAAAEVPGLRPVPLPAGEKWLTEHLAAKVLHRSQGRVLAVVGPTGGVGVTTFAYLCAAEMAARGMSPLVLDAAGGPGSGITDLVRTARREGRVSGGALDWQELESVEGELSAAQLRDALPLCEGISFLTGSTAGPRRDSTLRAAVVAARRAYDVVVIDSGQQAAVLGSLGEQVEDLLVVMRASRRGADAARELIRAVPQRRRHVAVNGSASPGWSAADVRTALGVPVVADLPRQKWLARSDELAQSYELLRSRRGAELLNGLLNEVGVADA
jgi:secretion/DNA translocation related CpaE-like protein